MSENKCLLDLQERFQEILLADGGLRTLCNTLKAELGKPLYILDSRRENLLYIDRELREAEYDFYDYLNNRTLAKQEVEELECGEELKLRKSAYTWKKETYREVEVKLGKEDKVLGIMSIFLADDESLAEDSCLMIMQGAYALSIKLHQNNLIQKLARKCSNELIEEIIQGRIRNEEELIKRGELAGWDLTVSYQLYVLRFGAEGETFKKAEERSLYTYELEEKIISKLHRIIRTTISRKYIIFSYDGDILLLINYSKPSIERREEAEVIHSRLADEFPDLEMFIAGGCFIEDCTEISTSYQQGLYTLNFLATTNQDNKVFFYEELGSLRLLWQIEEDELESFAREHLGELINYNQEDDTAWLETLGVFLESGSNFQKAANKLHLHPNTVRYRVDKLQKMLNFDFADFEEQVNLALAYKIHKFILTDNAGK